MRLIGIDCLPMCKWVDLCEVAAAQHSSTSWKVRFVTNITFYLDKCWMLDSPETDE